MRHRRLALALAVILAVPALSAVADPAGAAVPATPGQLTELTIAAEETNFIALPGGSAIRPEAILSEARVSTVDPTWAAAEVVYPALEEHRFSPRRAPNVIDVAKDGLALFHRDRGSRIWAMEDVPDPGCGAGANVRGVPVPVQVDLALPSCDLDGAGLGEKAFVLDASGRWKRRPKALVFLIDGVRVRIDGLKWFFWDVDRAASTFPARGHVGRDGTVSVTLDGYTHCEGRVAYGRAVIRGLLVRGSARVRRFPLSCPVPDYEPQPAPVVP